MIIKTTEMDLFCKHFKQVMFAKAKTEFVTWALEEVAPKHSALTNTKYFTRIGGNYPPVLGDAPVIQLHPSLCEAFDERYDQLRQMEELEGNYYEYLLRDLVANSGSLSDFYVLLPEAMHETLRSIGLKATDVPISVSSEQVVEFREKHAEAIAMFKRRKTMESIGVNKGSII
jgi:hypothetical protein|nr:MAG TPA: hypothetical protein [Caudoviricetes sp.]